MAILGDVLPAELRATLERAAGDALVPGESAALPSREGRLFRLRFGARDLALKAHDDARALHHDLFFAASLRTTRVPVPRVWASGLAGGPADAPWVLRDWVAGDPRAGDERSLGKQVGALVRAIHAVRVDGAGTRDGAGWRHADWAAFVRDEMALVPAQIDALPEPASTRARYRAVMERVITAALALGGPCSLLHGDLGLDNVIVHDGEVRAFIDPGWCLGGHPLMDVAYFLTCAQPSGPLRDGFLEGYGDVPGRDALPLFGAYQLFGKLEHFATTGDAAKYAKRRAQVDALLGM